ncbi:hypothetical protein [Cohnella sp. WQ 127256]
MTAFAGLDSSVYESGTIKAEMTFLIGVHTTLLRNILPYPH